MVSKLRPCPDCDSRSGVDDLSRLLVESDSVNDMVMKAFAKWNDEFLLISDWISVQYCRDLGGWVEARDWRAQ